MEASGGGGGVVQITPKSNKLKIFIFTRINGTT
jgi:hypothetical protein